MIQYFSYCNVISIDRSFRFPAPRALIPSGIACASSDRWLVGPRREDMTMSEQELLLANQEVFAALNAHDLERFAALLHPAFVWESDTLPNRITTREAARDIMQRF